jgi:hypothetical protein
MQDFLKRLCSMNRDEFLASARWSDVGPKGLQVITHILARLHILDQFVDALSFPPNPTLSLMGKLSFPSKFPDSVTRVWVHQIWEVILLIDSN